MEKKLFCFRFDVDTHVCMRKGVPNLIKLGEELGVHFTFFINMGRAISRIETLKRNLGKKELRYLDTRNMGKFSALKKLGLKEYIVSAVGNPKVGLGDVEIIKELYKKGHEFGLHGGTNHSLWQNNARKWLKEKFEQELLETLSAIKKHNLKRPVGFSSPGFQGGEKLNEVLMKLGFNYVSDTFKIKNSDRREGAFFEHKSVKLPNVHVNITSGNGISYIENLRSRGYSSQEIIEDFKKQLKLAKKYAVVYDHPGYAGTKELDTVRSMIQVARKLGYKPVTLHELYEHSTSGL